ncbi:hypothetical protein [Myxococcus sp. MxC21-1]|uniref:hypothetical protein n=1 Tax=Myxococcus sp. MxC21-1 TaxID=3041439 RepID=UPI0039777C8C
MGKTADAERSYRKALDVAPEQQSAWDCWRACMAAPAARRSWKPSCVSGCPPSRTRSRCARRWPSPCSRRRTTPPPRPRPSRR